MRVYGARFKRYCVLCSKHIAAPVVLSKLPAGSWQAAWGRLHLWDWSIHMATEVWVNIRAGVLVFGTRTHSTRVLNFWYSHCTNTREFQNDSTRTCTSWQVLRYSYEYWHEYWYSMVHLQCKCENHHTCEINSMTYHKGKFQIVFILLQFEYMIHGMWLRIHSFFQFHHHWKFNWITIIMFMFIVVIHPSPVSPFNIWLIYENFYSRLEKIHYCRHISWYCAISAFCFWTGKKL